MKEVLWLSLTIAVATLGIFIATTMLSSEPVSLGLTRDSKKGIGARVYLVLVIVGWLAVVAVGVHGLLAWLPRGDEVRWSFGLFAAFCSLPVLFHLERVTFMRQDLNVQSVALTWIIEKLRYGDTPSDALLGELSNESNDPRNSSTAQQIASLKRTLAVELTQHNERVAMRRERERLMEQQERERKQVAAEAKRRQDERAAITKAEQEARAAEVSAVLARLTRPTSTAKTPEDLRDGSESLIDWGVVEPNWLRFRAFTQKALEPTSSGFLAVLLGGLPGVEVRKGAEIVLRFEGTERDGYCDAIATVEGTSLPLLDVLRFDPTFDGLLSALFIGTALTSRWSWGHGCYGRDDGLVAGVEGLTRVLTDSPFSQATMKDVADSTWPPAGIRASRVHDGLRASALVINPSTGVLDKAIEVIGGGAKFVDYRVVYSNPRNVLY